MTILTRGPKPVYYVMGKQSKNNSHPGTWVILHDTAKSDDALDVLEEMANDGLCSMYYDELAIHMCMGTVPLQGVGHEPAKL